MAPAIIAVLVLILLVVLGACAVVIVGDRLREWRSRRRREAAPAVPERDLMPDWSFYERHLRRPVPPAIRELFDDEALRHAESLDCDDEITVSFDPPSESSLRETREFIGVDVIPFATNIYGDPIYLRPGPAESNAVYVTHHDGGNTERLSDDIAMFVDRLRTSQGRGLSR